MNGGCGTEVCDFQEITSWCAKMFDYNYKVVKVNRERNLQISLTPSMFNRMLWLPEQTKVFMMMKDSYFLDAHGDGFIILN